MVAISVSLDDLIAGANLATRQTALFKHPRVLENIIIARSRMMDVAARGKASAGHLYVRDKSPQSPFIKSRAITIIVRDRFNGVNWIRQRLNRRTKHISRTKV